MGRDVIERDIPGTGSVGRGQLRAAATKSNDSLSELARDIQWIESFVAADKTVCVDFANNEDVIQRAEIPRFPATKIMPIGKVIRSDDVGGLTAGHAGMGRRQWNDTSPP